jgi:hypothetical protein
MEVRRRARGEFVESTVLEDLRSAVSEERLVEEVFDERREMAFFVIPVCPDRVTAERLVSVLSVIFDDPDRVMDRTACVEEKLLPTFRIFDLARTLDAF